MIASSLSKKRKSAFFIIVIAGCLSVKLLKAQQIVTVFLKVQTKKTDYLADTAMKVWYNDTFIKVRFFFHDNITINVKNGVSSLTIDTNKSLALNKVQESTNRLEYIKNISTGDAFDVMYGSKGVVVWKRKENIRLTLIDSTEKIYLAEQKVIAGYVCQKVILVNKITRKRDTMFVTKGLNGLRHPFFRYLDVFPMEYEDNGTIYTVDEIAISKVNDENIFSIPDNSIIINDYNKWINFLKKNE